MIDFIISLLAMVWLINAIAFPLFLLYDLAVNTFILRGESTGLILKFQNLKWGWMLNYIDDMDYDTGALTWLILDVFAGIVLLGVAVMAIATGLLWYVLMVTAALYIAREVADSVRGNHD